MNSSTLRRLASDHHSFHTSGLPPNYLFPPSNAFSSVPDDLTQLTILLAGPQGTPYSQGLWRLHLKMPDDYPKSPPKASFRTRIWHPNVEESTGSVCVDTLKRDWETKLTLRDVLITISCLLIHPNPDSALNSAAGSLLQEDYEGFARQAKLMTSIHALVPKDMKDAVLRAKCRGEEAGARIQLEEEERPSAPRASSRTSSVTMKKTPQHRPGPNHVDYGIDMGITTSTRGPALISRPTSSTQSDMDPESEEGEDEATASKENDPSLSPSPVTFAPASPRKNVLGKRPLSSLPTPIDPDAENSFYHSDDDFAGMGPSEKNIAANASNTPPRNSKEPQKKSPKLTESGKGVNASGRIRDDDNDVEGRIYEDNAPEIQSPQIGQGEEKENFHGGSGASSGKEKLIAMKKTGAGSSGGERPYAPNPSTTVRKVSTASASSSGKGKARVGVRRL